MVKPTIGVFAATFDQDECILCVRQAYGPKRWTNPGGRLEDGEHPCAGVLRELYEETGYKGTVIGFLGTYIALYKKPVDIVLMFRVQLNSRDNWKPNGEISACEFFAEPELPHPMAYNTQIRMADAFSRNENILRVFPTSQSLLPNVSDYTDLHAWVIQTLRPASENQMLRSSISL